MGNKLPSAGIACKIGPGAVELEWSITGPYISSKVDENHHRICGELTRTSNNFGSMIGNLEPHIYGQVNLEMENLIPWNFNG